MEEIVEQRPPRPARFDQNGLTAARQFSILARSDVEAITKLRDKVGISRGTIYADAGGNIPDPSCVATSIEAVGKPPASGDRLGLYVTTIDYASVMVAPQQAQPGKPPVWSVRASLQSVPVEIDPFGEPILSSSLEPLDPPLTALRPTEVLHGEFYVPGADAIAVYIPFRPFNGSVNADRLPRLGAEPGTLLCHVFQPEPSDTGWIKVAVDFEYRAPKVVDGRTFMGWEEVYRDYGTRQFESVTDTAVNAALSGIKDAEGKTVRRPVPLDGAGQPAQVGQFGAVRSVMLYRLTTFSAIPFPNGM